VWAARRKVAERVCERCGKAFASCFPRWMSRRYFARSVGWINLHNQKLNTTEMKICQSCKATFAIEPDDFTFYEKSRSSAVAMPLCRAQLRLAFKNERSYYKRPCDKCKRDVVSMYSPNKPYTVWCYECWFAG